MIWRRIFKPGYVVGALCVLLLSAALILVLNSDGDSNLVKGSVHRSQTKQAEPSAVSSSAPPVGPVVMPAARNDKLVPTVTRFIKAYFHRDARLTEQSFRQLLRPMVTSTFFDRRPMRLSTQSDEWVRRNNGVIDASVLVYGDDRSIIADRALVQADVVVVGIANNKKTQPFAQTVQVELSWRNNRWKISNIT